MIMRLFGKPDAGDGTMVAEGWDVPTRYVNNIRAANHDTFFRSLPPPRSIF